MLAYEPLLTSEEVAKMLAITDPGTLGRWRAAGFGPPFIKINDRMYRYRARDVEAWVESQKHPAVAAGAR